MNYSRIAIFFAFTLGFATATGFALFGNAKRDSRTAKPCVKCCKCEEPPPSGRGMSCFCTDDRCFPGCCGVQGIH